MVAEAPPDLVVVGDGALMAALTRSRGTRMRDIVATIQRHQDEAIRASARGITEITGGPGTGKTVVALHRAAYLLYCDRRRYESGGILVVGPSAAYTSYIERVLPSLGEETVTLRSLGDVVDAVSTERLDTPAAAAVKGSLRIRQVLSRAAHDAVPDGPEEFRAFVAGFAVRLPRQTLDQVRSRVLRQHQRNLAHDTGRPAARRRRLPAERAPRARGLRRAGSRTTSRSPPSSRTGGRSWTRARCCSGSRTRSGWPATPRAFSTTRSGRSCSLRCGWPWRPASGRSPTSRSSTTSPRGWARSRTPRARSGASTRSRSSTTCPRAASPSWAAERSPTGSNPHTP